ncbi:MAG: 3-deoxy-manno-octulosonate cytidylyltransferase [Planctomycetota bacterium]
MTPRTAVIIPARVGSTRLPRKMLLAETGRPLIQHTYENARRARLPAEVLIAADSPEIIAAVAPFGSRAVLTSPAHPSGTDRIAEAARGLEAEIIVNVQGDEPELDPAVIDAMAAGLAADPACGMITACCPLDAGRINDPSAVKVVLDRAGYALYFSRAPIPFKREAADAYGQGPFLHLGIYGYRREFLLELTQWPPSALERTERLEQLRVLENGRRIRVVQVASSPPGIDTAEDYRAFVDRWNRDRRHD